MSQQIHSGEGDNVAGNKTTNINVKIKWLVLAIVGISAVVIAIYLWPKAPQFSGVVTTSADIPIKNAKVMLRIPGQPALETFTDDFGTYAFPKVNPKKVKTYTIKAQLEERSITQEGRGADALINPVIIKLPPGDAPFDVAYYTVSGDNGVPSILTGAVSDSLAAKIDGQPYIIPNAVWQHLKALNTKYPGQLVDAVQNYSSISVPFTDDQLKKILVGVSGWEQQEDWNGPYLKLPAHEWEGIVNHFISVRDFVKAGSNSEYNINEELQDTLRVAQFRFQGARKYATKEEIELLFPFYEEITKDYLPDEFLRMELSVEACISSFLDGVYYDVAPLKMKIAVITNRSGRQLRVGDFFIQENGTARMRTYSEDQVSLAETAVSDKQLLPQKRLNDGESILVPLWSFLGEGDGDDDGDYIFGPSWKIADVNIGIEQYAVRDFDPELLVLYNSQGYGSCPYVYTQTEEGDWLREDHFLAKHNSKLKEGLDTLLLKRFTGKLWIRELDPETSYIDHIQVTHIDEDGTIQNLSHNHNTLRATDKRYHVMNTGDEVYLDFPEFDPKEAGNYYLISSGYYIPDTIE